jgi:class 3 adenylate cyclase
VHEAARIAGQAEAGEILASTETAAGARFPRSDARSLTLKGISEPMEVVSLDWR